MLSKEKLLELKKIGDKVDTGAVPIPGVSGDTIKAVVVEVEPEKYWIFELFYMGVFFGEVSAEMREGKVVWEEL